MSDVFFWTFFAAIALALVCSVRAFGRLSPLGQARPGRVLWLGRAAGRKYFDEQGWRLRCACLIFQAVAFAAAVGWVVTSP